MKQKLIQLFIGFSAVVALTVSLTAPVLAATSSSQAVCEGLGLSTGAAPGQGCVDPAGSRTLSDVIAVVVNILSILVGVIAVIMIIIGGLKYVLSSGDSNNVSSAKNTILYAVVGLVVVALAQVIVRFVLKNVG